MEIVIISWLVLAFLVGMLANSRGRSGFGFFLLAVVTSPLLGLIIVLVIRDLKQESAESSRRIADSIEAERRQRQAHERQLESLRALAAAAPSPEPPAPAPTLAPAPAAPPAWVGSVADEIEKLGSLRDRGLLTNEEFIAQKARILGTTRPA